jgi:hypothetical protein
MLCAQLRHQHRQIFAGVFAGAQEHRHDVTVIRAQLVGTSPPRLSPDRARSVPGRRSAPARRAPARMMRAATASIGARQSGSREPCANRMGAWGQRRSTSQPKAASDSSE